MKLISLPVIAAFVGLLSLTACGGGGTKNNFVSTEPNQPTALQITDTVVGTGNAAQTGSVITANYTGWLWSSTASGNKGTQFDSNAGKAPIQVTLGAGQVIKGWDQGLVGMKTGGKRTLVIPASLAYGANGNPPTIPGNSALVFEIELLSVR
ncbi:FKBP-type peptidyl-prolyl cis-trans isomerase [Massilia sp. TS11]|uniref:FKBP-type peptidyl-prolyl cis-trans isomerase n=1 Tax=Massilia sp. TS11 TaxID=2908003 RepID=UPI001EDB002E|nr:FKBP-type peptidyl-prolyl cis-trans isomerase [Massilia sp. TS11]MCG2585749.1 FKBP-type peptidyl-prolyl cis-trans isomerase [Massilia sp. TS11]